MKAYTIHTQQDITGPENIIGETSTVGIYIPDELFVGYEGERPKGFIERIGERGLERVLIDIGAALEGFIPDSCSLLAPGITYSFDSFLDRSQEVVDGEREGTVKELELDESKKRRMNNVVEDLNNSPKDSPFFTIRLIRHDNRCYRKVVSLVDNFDSEARSIN